jgi:hypothetical protein
VFSYKVFPAKRRTKFLSVTQFCCVPPPLVTEDSQALYGDPSTFGRPPYHYRSPVPVHVRRRLHCMHAMRQARGEKVVAVQLLGSLQGGGRGPNRRAEQRHSTSGLPDAHVEDQRARQYTTGRGMLTAEFTVARDVLRAG